VIVEFSVTFAESRPTAIFLLALLTTLVVTSSETPSLFGGSTVFTSVCLAVNIITQKKLQVIFLKFAEKVGCGLQKTCLKFGRLELGVGVKNSGLKFVLTTLWRKYTLCVPSNAV